MTSFTAQPWIRVASTRLQHGNRLGKRWCRFWMGRRHYQHTSLLLAPHKLSQVKQKPLFPGMYRTVKSFDGEHTYNYGKHTFTIMWEGFTFVIIPLGCIVAYIATFFSPFADVPLHFQSAYLALLFLSARLYARGRSHGVRKDLTGRHVIVTGGTSGIGRETAAQLVAMGADVTVLARNGPQVEAAMAYIRRFTSHPEQAVQFSPLDLSDFLAVRDYCRRVRSTAMKLDILVNNAGVMYQKQVMSRFGDDEQLAVNLLGPYLLTEGLLPLIAENGGRIVNVSCSAHVAVRGSIVQTYLSGRGLWSPRVRGKFDGLEQYGFTKLGCIYSAQELATRSYTYGAATSPVASLLDTGLSPPGAASAGGKPNRPTHFHHRQGNISNISSGGNSSTASSIDHGVVGNKSRKNSGGGDNKVVVPKYTACVAVPGGVITNIYRHVPLFVTFRWLRYIYLLFMRTAREGSQTVVNCCLRDDIVNGGYYQNCRYAPSGLSAAACSVSERDSVLLWVRRKMQPYMSWDR